MRNSSRFFCTIIVSTFIIAFGCKPVKVPLKGKYSNNKVEITSTKSIDSAWSNLTKIFTTNGLPINNVDKKKGIILTAKCPINSVYTFEDKDGQLLQPQAWVVLSKVFNKKKGWQPKNIYGQWSIQITESDKGITTIKIDSIVICTYFPNTFTKMETSGQSTGKMEELLKQSLKNN